MINEDFLLPLIIAWMVSGWLYMTKRDCELAYDHVPLFDTTIYTSLMTISPTAIIIALIMNIFDVGFLSTLCYVGILLVIQFLNFGIFYPAIYRRLFGYSGIGALIPVLLIIPVLIWLYLV